MEDYVLQFKGIKKAVSEVQNGCSMLSYLMYYDYSNGDVFCYERTQNSEILHNSETIIGIGIYAGKNKNITMKSLKEDIYIKCIEKNVYDKAIKLQKKLTNR